MISIENHDPSSSSSCPPRCDPILHDLIKSSDDKVSASASVSDQNNFALLEEIDLLKSGLDDSNPLPKFSIREYVFSSRSKDIAANWPFSQKNLQLCLKHGVKNLLPPFHSLDLLRDSSANRCGVENRLPGEEILSSCDGKKPSRVTSDENSAKFNQELAALDSVSTTSSGSKESQPLLKPTNKSPNCSDLEESKIPLASQQTESTAQDPVTKCRLVVKLNPVVNTNQDLAPNNYMVSETMASKVCPVCKTFSSSSNTTLNAHIDQCLSGESTMKWPANSKVIKHNRIKPRKTRLMVDIYVTAPHCTLEELDRRNGTNWATNSSFPAQEIEFHGEEREKEKEKEKEKEEEEEEEEEEEQKVPRVNLEDTAGHEGAVYIDTNGTKVRILSVPTLGTGDDHGSRKLVKGGKGGKLLTSKKRKKIHEQKHHKYLKLAPHSKKFCSPKPRRDFETISGRADNCALEGSCKKEDRQKLPFKAQGHRTLDDLGTIRPPWACSRRTGHAKKSSGKDESLHSSYNATKDLPVESDKSSSSGGSHLERRFISRTPSSSDNIVSSSKSSKKKDTSSNEPLVDRYRVGFHSGAPVGGFSKKRSLLSTKQRIKQLRKEGACLHGNGENCASSLSNKAVETNADPSKNYDDFSNSSTGSRFSSLRKNLLSVSRESMSASNFNLKRKFSALKKSRVNCISDDDRFQASTKQQSRMEEEGSKVLKIRKEGAIRICGRKELRENIDSSVQYGDALVDSLDDHVESSRKEIQTHGEHMIVDTAIRMDVEGSFVSLSKSLSPEFHKLASPPHAQFDSQQCIEMYQGPFCGDKDKMFCADGIDRSKIEQEIRNGTYQLDTQNVQQGNNYFDEDDPIPIPGPPGSFLPSPGGDMVSEDVQGHSSLTTSRVQSCEDHHDNDMVDRDYSFSDSPISATSTISNPTSARSDSTKEKEKSAPAPAPPVQVAANLMGAEKTHVDDWRVNPIFPEKGSIGLKNNQPCCCSRKEGASQSVASNFQELAQLRRNQLDSTNKRPNSSLNLRSEMFSLTNYPISPAPEMMVKSPVTHIPLAADSAVKFPIHSDCDSASPSKPVLRLMGKNLTVVKKDEDVSPPQLKPPAAMNDHLNQQQFCGPSSGNVQNQEYHSYQVVFPQGSIMFGKNPNDFKNYVDLKTPHIPIHASEKMFPNTTPHGLSGGTVMASMDYYGFGGPHLDCTPQAQTRACQDHTMERHEYKGGSYLAKVEQTRPRNRFDHTQLACERNNGYSGLNPIKEIIIIDDSPENEADSATDNERVRRNRVSSSPIPIHMYNSRNVNPFYNYQSHSSVPYSGSLPLPMVRNAGFQNQPPFREVNGSLAKWNCIPEGSRILQHPSSLAASSPSTCHLRSAVNYPPS